MTDCQNASAFKWKHGRSRLNIHRLYWHGVFIDYGVLWNSLYLSCPWPEGNDFFYIHLPENFAWWTIPLVCDYTSPSLANANLTITWYSYMYWICSTFYLYSKQQNRHWSTNPANLAYYSPFGIHTTPPLPGLCKHAPLKASHAI